MITILHTVSQCHSVSLRIKLAIAKPCHIEHQRQHRHFTQPKEPFVPAKIGVDIFEPKSEFGATNQKNRNVHQYEQRCQEVKCEVTDVCWVLNQFIVLILGQDPELKNESGEHWSEPVSRFLRPKLVIS